MRYKRPGFSLIELMIVIAIVAIMMTLGYQSMAQFQRSVLIKSAANELLTILKGTRTMAENNVEPIGSTVFIDENVDSTYGYILNFNVDGVTRYFVDLERFPVSSVNQNDEENVFEMGNLRSDQFNDIEYDVTCGEGSVFFANVTGNIYTVNQRLEYDNDGACEIAITYNGDSSKVIFISINPASGVIKQL